jgi:cyclic pyranopterin phosphate synthase
VRLEETGQKVGFITPLSHNFCESCNRVRLTCTGQLHTCLGRRVRRTCGRRCGPRRTTRASRTRSGGDPAQAQGHDFDYSRGVEGKISRHMSHTGG